MSDKPLLDLVSHIDGKNAKVRVYADRVEWERGKSMSGGKLTAAVLTAGMSAAVTGGVKSRKGAGTEVIPMRSITSVTTRRDSILNDVVSVITAGNTIDMRVSRSEGQALKSTILAQMNAAHAPVTVTAAATAPAAPAAAPSAADHIAQLAQLHQSGVLSDEEFAAAKAKALGL